MTCEVDSEYTSLRLFDEALFVQFQVIKHLFEQSLIKCIVYTKKKHSFVKKETDTQIFVYKKTRQQEFLKVCLKNRNFLFLETEKMFMPTYRVAQNGMPT